MSGHPQTQEVLDLRERGAPRDGSPQYLERRLFMQLLVLDCPAKQSPPDVARSLGQGLAERKLPGVVYEDVSHPRACGLLTWSEDPRVFVEGVRPLCQSVGELDVRAHFSMLGRTYSSGFEDDLNYWLLQRPVKTVMNPEWPWAVWYPLRRSGAFEKLEPREKGGIMREHAEIGKAYGVADLAHDVRLACHGLDTNDNEFVIGLVGKDLYPLSHVVQSMRRTRQTSEYIVQMGPFFVGRAVLRCDGNEVT